MKFEVGPAEGTAGRTVASAADPSAGHDSHEGRTRHAVVRLLMESGSVTAGEIGARLGLSAAGVRRHLDALIEMGDAEAHAAASWRHTGRGRPAKRYQLTSAGRDKLGHRYDELAAAALSGLRDIGGESAVVDFARGRIDAILSQIAPADHGTPADVYSTAQRIAAALTDAGYAATTSRVDAGVPAVQILQHHCPIANVAKQFPQLCQAERDAMAQILGTHVQRLATIADGGYVCTTHVPLVDRTGTATRQ